MLTNYGPRLLLAANALIELRCTKVSSVDGLDEFFSDKEAGA